MDTDVRVVTFNAAAGNPRIKTVETEFLELPFYREALTNAPGAPVLAVPGVVWLVAALLLAYLFGTVLYVKTMIRERGVRSYVVASVAYHAAVTAAAGVVAVVHDPSWWWATAFLVAATVRAATLPGRPLSPRAVGIGEIVATVLLLVVALVVR